MDVIHIPQLLTVPEQAMVLEVNEFFADLASLTPVQGQLKVEHHGNYLQVDAEVATIVTLTCDRCLQHYNHRLATQVAEVLWLEEMDTTDLGTGVIDLPAEGPVETLLPDGTFDPADWLYQQLCLQWPQRQLCDRNCPGMETQSDTTDPPLDQRWAALAALQNVLSQESS